MKFFKYGITLERLREEDIELVRQWRNSDPVRLNMKYREIISPEKQREWFNSINNVNFHYVIIQYRGEKIGLLNDKNIDWETLTSETGIFIGRPELNSAQLAPLLVDRKTPLELVPAKMLLPLTANEETNAFASKLELTAVQLVP